MTSNAPAAPASKPEGRVDEMRGEANQAIATDKSQLTARAQQMQGEANQAIATDESKLAQKDQEIVSELQQLANLPPELTLVLGQKVLQCVRLSGLKMHLCSSMHRETPPPACIRHAWGQNTRVALTYRVL